MDGDSGTIRLAPGVTVTAGQLHYSAVASGGPGGQHANKVATKVELRLRLEDLGLRVDALLRLRALASHLVTGEGELVIIADETRSQRRNRELALERLRELVIAALVRPKPRRPTKPSRGSIRRRLEGKAHQADRIRDRRPSSGD